MEKVEMTQSPAPPRLPATWEADLASAGLLIWIIISATILAFFFDLSIVLVVGQLLVLLPVLIWVLIRRLPFRETFRVRPIAAGTALESLLIGFACWPISAAAATLIEKPLSLIGPAPSAPIPTGLLQSAAYAITFVIIAPLTEEPIYRGFILRAWLRRGAPAAIIVSGFLFGLVHSQINALLPLAFFGIVLGLVSYRSGSIVSTVLVHAAYNFIPTLLFLIPSLQTIQDTTIYLAGLIAIPILVGLLWLFLRNHRAAPVENPPRETSSILWPILTLGIVVGLFCMMALLEIFMRLNPALTSGA